MKILNLYFKNINSLEGENRIDFEQPPFSDAGVFAITGPNGSGKSSILDAITLALYGETFRFDKPAQHIITHHTFESFSQVEFALGGEKYRSSWHVKRVGDSPWGEVLPSEMQLIRLNESEEVMASTTQHVCARIMEITGMDFRSFTRSILLAQGDFAAFLNALDMERMDILEKIIGSDIYTDYKKEMTEKQAEAEKNRLYLQQDLAAIPLITPESLEACELDLADYSDQVHEINNIINDLLDKKFLLAETVTARQQVEGLESKLQEAIAQRMAVQKKLDQLADGEKALEFKETIEASQLKQQELVQEQSALAALQNELKQIESTLALPGFDAGALSPQALAKKQESFEEQKQAIDNIRNQVGLYNANWQSEIILQKSLADQIAEKEAALADVTAWLKERTADKLLSESFPEIDRLKNIRLVLDEFTEKKQALAKWTKSTSAALYKNKDNINSKNNSIEQQKKQLLQEEKDLEGLAQGSTLEQLLELQEEQQERVKAYEELVDLAVVSEQLKPQRTFFFGLFGKQVIPSRSVQELEDEFEALKLQQKQEENIRLSLERSVYNDALISRMAQDREHLIDGKPCPLCGGTEHPYAKYPPAPTNSQQALLDQRIKIKRLSVRYSELEEQLKLAKKYAERNSANQVRLQQVNARWLTLCNQLNVATKDFDIKKTDEMKKMLKDESTELKNIGLLLDKYKGTQKRIAKIKATIEKHQASIEQSQATVKNLELEWQTEPDKVEKTESDIDKVQQQEQELAAKITELLAQLNEKLPIKGKEDELIARLNLRRQDYESFAYRNRSLISELELLSSKQSASQAQIDNYKKQIEQFNHQLHNEEVVGLHLALVEKQKLIANKEQFIKQLQAEMESLRKTIGDKLEGTSFSNLDEVIQILGLLDSRPEFAEQKVKLDEDVARWGSELDKLCEQLESVGQTEEDLSSEEIEAQLKVANEKMELAELEAHRLETIIKEQKQYQEKQASLMAQLANQEAQAQLAKAEVAEIMSDTGMAFRRKVQARMIEKLLSQTNAILEKISGRYYLRHKPSDRGLALEIEDTYQGNVRRFPKTLSGGESFVVSLSLALALSEMASSGRSVDTLFLDEGFGSLDGETLYTVINTLEGLRAHGKTVGVISHVEAVQKRFKVQLQLVKKPNGLGELRKVS